MPCSRYAAFHWVNDIYYDIYYIYQSISLYIFEDIHLPVISTIISAHDVSLLYKKASSYVLFFMFSFSFIIFSLIFTDFNLKKEKGRIWKSKIGQIQVKHEK